MTPERLAKIRAMATDLRGDPATRMVAMEILRRYEPESEFHDVEDEKPQNPPNPRMRNSDEYVRFSFMSLRNWGKSANGNFVHSFVYKDRAYRMVLFKHKKTPTFGWLRVDVARSEEVWSGRFRTIEEAHRDAWNTLLKV